MTSHPHQNCKTCGLEQVLYSEKVWQMDRFSQDSHIYLLYCIHVGDTGLRGPTGEAGIPGTKGDQGKIV